MKTLELKKNFYYNGVHDTGLRVFDIVMRTEFGTTYNSYILKGSEKTALFETAKLKFYDEYIESVKAVTNVADIDYIIVDHTEPDHAGSIEKLIELNPNIKIVATATALGFLKHIVNRDFYSVTVKDKDTLSLGDKTLKFMVLPNLHWPDSMYTYIVEDKTLVTCDSFGAHYCHEDILRSKVKNEDDYLGAAKYYFDNIIGPYKNPYMVRALKRVRELEVDMICPGHGPVHDAKIPELLALYDEWCEDKNPNTKKTVVMPYVSAYGYTKQLGEKIAEGVRDAGDIEVRLYDMAEADAGAVLGEIGHADGLLFGTPTIIGEALSPIWALTTSMFAPVHKGKLASAFGSYGWSGEGVPHIIERLKQIKLRVPDEGFRIRFKPSDNQLLDAYEYGYNFGCILLDKENDRAKSEGKGPKKLVKCLVCGAIFDSSLEVCPVCNVGKENFVPVEEEEDKFVKNTEEKFLVLGGGAAALSAAEAIRERNKTASIIMISDEEILPYNRPMLTKSMLADFTSDQMAVHTKDWYEENNIETVLSTAVEKIDPDSKTVTAGGKAYAYDKLIYALGAKAFVPPFKGADGDHVISIRTIKDTRKIKEMLAAVKNVVVIGGGVLGLEAAWELKKTGCAVTVLEAGPALMGRQLDAAASNMIAAILEKNGFTLVTGAKIAEIGKDAVALEDGRSFAAELVVVSTGVSPNVAIAKEAGIYAERNIFVSDKMETSVDDIYACGDCAQCNGINYALWSQSVAMGQVAGANAAGDETKYEGITGALVFNGLNSSLFSLGDNGKKPDKSYRTVELKDDQRHMYEKYYFLNNRLVGVILIGDTSKMVKLTEDIKNGAKFEDVIKIN
ncbi:MAG: FAD-dependent oxidoreductase [Clostridia bacterium]|nr:FAD-dependent oxidoreductase [Clostridia bacterium]